ncbi:MAG: UpxY family transcription antiterminator [Bacteroides sp.]|nr:UpxY family transcription antiterminator [Roseburia sp.]MCM1347417.1 UpxY family transcription antiterminator [Bacteroides sp.]MCM1421579.1 UpxY family transcription antiterminator [Bacteroides sp.]
MTLQNEPEKQWFVMRDLKRANAKLPAYRLLLERQIEVFTPMKWRLVSRQGIKTREEVPFIQDLLFVHDTRDNIDPIVAKTPTLQYRFLRNTYRKPMTVPPTEMERFIRAVGTSESPRYYLPEEITPEMYGRKIRIIGGPLNGYEGSLLTTRGSKTKRLLVEIPNLLAVGVEVNPEYIQLVNEKSGTVRK